MAEESTMVERIARVQAVAANWWLGVEKKARGPAPLRLFDWAKWGSD